MKAIGHLKFIDPSMHELYEIEKASDWRYVPWAIDFLDCPGDIEPKVGDKFTSWYWIPIPLLRELNTYGQAENLR